MDKELKQYFKSIKYNLNCSNRLKVVFIKEFKNRVNDYLEDNPNANIEEIISFFGSAEEIANSFGNDTEFYKNKAKKRFFIELGLVIVLIFCIAIASYFILTLLNDLGGNITITTK